MISAWGRDFFSRIDKDWRLVYNRGCLINKYYFMQVFNVAAAKRLEMGKKVKTLRAEGQCPAVIYGPELKENVYIKMREADMRKLYNEAGESSIINLTVEGAKEPMEVLIKDVEYDPITQFVTHVDFYKIKRGQKIEASVELKFIGEAPAVKILGGVLVVSIDEVTIKCLPKDLMSEIQVDLSGLKTFEDSIHIKDLNLTEGVEIMADANETVAAVSEIKEEVIEDKAPVVDMPKPEEGKEGKEGDDKAKTEEKPAGNQKK